MNYAFQGRHLLAKLVGMTIIGFFSQNASTSFNSSVWLTNTECNAHLTSDLAKLNLSLSYKEIKQLLLAYG